MQKKKEETYTLKQILQVVKDMYEVESYKDSWGIPVIYEKHFITVFRNRIKKIKQFVK